MEQIYRAHEQPTQVAQKAAATKQAVVDFLRERQITMPRPAVLFWPDDFTAEQRSLIMDTIRAWEKNQRFKAEGVLAMGDDRIEAAVGAIVGDD